MSAKSSMAVLAVIALLTGVFPAGGCAPARLPASTGYNNEKGNLVGPVTEAQLYRSCPEWRDNASRYSAKPEIVEQLRKIDSKLEIIVFFGTWCGDSRGEVPKFLQVYDTVANGNFSLRMYGVDRSGSEGSVLAEKFSVEKVPTFIFISGDKELGRIVESPQKTMEEDFLSIVTDIKPASVPDSYPDDDDEPDTEYA